MSQRRLGMWFVGAHGGVATAALAGLSALQRGLAPTLGLVSECPTLTRLPLPAWGDFVAGGHEIRAGSLVDELEAFHRTNRVIDREVVEACRDDLAAIDRRIRRGTLWNVGSRIAALAPDAAGVEAPASARAEVARLGEDLRAFCRDNQLDSAVVINLASTEPPGPEFDWPREWSGMEPLLDQPDVPLPASSLYAIAAFEAGLPYVNFTPSTGACLPGIESLAVQRGLCHAGRDGKTGETLLKSVLAPMFAARRLEVMSWVGHNIFGNLDGKVLDDPENKAAKVKSKDALLGEILGYPLQTLVSIEHIASLGDWKTAWDHIHFRGFLGTPMTLQLTWQGCDSMLAAPLVLDLARLTTFAARNGACGPLGFLSSFFKSPIGCTSHAFADQVRELELWATSF